MSGCNGDYPAFEFRRLVLFVCSFIVVAFVVAALSVAVATQATQIGALDLCRSPKGKVQPPLRIALARRLLRTSHKRIKKRRIFCRDRSHFCHISVDLQHFYGRKTVALHFVGAAPRSQSNRSDSIFNLWCLPWWMHLQIIAGSGSGIHVFTYAQRNGVGSSTDIPASHLDGLALDVAESNGNHEPADLRKTAHIHCMCSVHSLSICISNQIDANHISKLMNVRNSKNYHPKHSHARTASPSTRTTSIHPFHSNRTKTDKIECRK